MKFNHIQSRHQIVAIVALLYLLPLIILCAVPLFHEGTNPEWVSFPLGMLLSCCGSLLIFVLLGSHKSQQVVLPPPPVVEVVPAPASIEEESVDFSLLLEEKEKELAIEKEELLKQQEFIAAQEKANEQLLEEINYRNEEMQKLTQERENSKHLHQLLQEEFQLYKEKSLKQLEEEKEQANSLQETISELRGTIDHKQEQVELLENKIHDLTYEIKTLLQLADTSSFSSEPSFDTTNNPLAEGFVINEEAHHYQLNIKTAAEEKKLQEKNGGVSSPFYKEHYDEQLKRCIDIAQKITGSHHLTGYNSRFRDLGMDSYTLDLRRLCDNLRSENSCTVFVFSPKENKLLFVNNQIKDLLGWSPEKFQQEFSSIIEEGLIEWRDSLSQLNAHNQTKTRLVMKQKVGQELLIECQLGLIPTGVFRHNVVGILYGVKFNDTTAQQYN